MTDQELSMVNGEGEPKAPKAGKKTAKKTKAPKASRNAKKAPRKAMKTAKASKAPKASRPSKKAPKASQAKRGESYSLNFRVSPSFVKALDESTKALNMSRVDVLVSAMNALTKREGIKAPDVLRLIRGRPPIQR